VFTTDTSKAVTAGVKVLLRYGAATLAAALCMTVGACTSDDDATSTPSSAVIQPGRPGEGNTTIAPEDFVDDDAGTPRWNQADADYTTMMIGHHVQALEIAELAPDRAQHKQVKAIADRIHDTQGAEIHALAAWLEERDLPVPAEATEFDGEGPRAPGGHSGHEPGHEMPGMVTDAQMAALEAASGPEFDRLFLEAMVQHHQGAVDMSVTVLEEGLDPRLNEMATEIGAAQQAEIGRLNDILALL
jgi:uncharacterized protein (DUF305 family)